MGILKKVMVVALVGVLAVVAGVLAYTNMDIMEQISLSNKPFQGVPESSASAITSPPPSMEGINTHTEVYGTGADPDVITLGPKTAVNQAGPHTRGRQAWSSSWSTGHQS